MPAKIWVFSDVAQLDVDVIEPPHPFAAVLDIASIWAASERSVTENSWLEGGIACHHSTEHALVTWEGTAIPTATQAMAKGRGDSSSAEPARRLYCRSLWGDAIQPDAAGEPATMGGVATDRAMSVESFRFDRRADRSQWAVQRALGAGRTEGHRARGRSRGETQPDAEGEPATMGGVATDRAMSVESFRFDRRADRSQWAVQRALGAGRTEGHQRLPSRRSASVFAAPIRSSTDRRTRASRAGQREAQRRGAASGSFALAPRALRCRSARRWAAGQIRFLTSVHMPSSFAGIQFRRGLRFRVRPTNACPPSSRPPAAS